jgi:hypothetical protein
MQQGPSSYEYPPALPNQPIPTSISTQTVLPTSPHSLPPHLSGMPPPVYVGGINHSVVGSPGISKAPKKNAKGTLTQKQPPTLSGFKNLHCLAILDLGTLDYGTELKQCLFNSSTSLKNLKLSFSEGLASRSRKPPPGELE